MPDDDSPRITLFIVRHPRWKNVGLIATALAAAAALPAQSLSVAAPPSLLLANYDRVPVGQREGLEAGAFIARTNDAGAGWYNPAGLAQHDGSAVNGSATAYEWTRLTLSGFGITTDRGKLSSVGTYFGVVIGRPVLRSDKWRLGASLTRPVKWNPSTFDIAFNPPGGNADDLFGYATRVDLWTMIPAVSVGYAPRGVGKSNVRLGVGIAYEYTSLSHTLSLSDRVTTPTSATTRLSSFSAEGSVGTGLVTGGLQWDLSPRATLGARLVLPGIRLFGSTRLALEASDFSGTAAADVTFHDEDATFHYKDPLEADVALMVRFPRGEIEMDVRYHGSAGRYPLYTSDSIARIRVVTGAPPLVSSAPYATTYHAAGSVTNIAVGGNYRFTRALRVHAGFLTDGSPTPSDAESIFANADLYRVTAGLSFTFTALSGSIGFAYGWGAGAHGRFGTTTPALPPDAGLEVRTLNLMYALSYAFGQKPNQ